MMFAFKASMVRGFFGKLSLSDIPIRNNQTPSFKWQISRDAARQAGNRLASWRTAVPCRNNYARCRHTQQTHSCSFLTQRTYSCSNFIPIFSLVLELLKKCRRGSVASGTLCICV
jgi:hypothetical protein